jgi:hypothetical protein
MHHGCGFARAGDGEDKRRTGVVIDDGLLRCRKSNWGRLWRCHSDLLYVVGDR